MWVNILAIGCSWLLIHIHFTDQNDSLLNVTYSMIESIVTLHWPYTRYGPCNYTVSWDSGSRTEVVHAIQSYIAISTQKISPEETLFLRIEIECLCHRYAPQKCTKKSRSELLQFRTFTLKSTLLVIFTQWHVTIYLCQSPCSTWPLNAMVLFLNFSLWCWCNIYISVKRMFLH